MDQIFSYIGPENKKYIFFLTGKINNNADLLKKKGKAKFCFNFLPNIIKWQSNLIVNINNHIFLLVFGIFKYKQFGISLL